MQLEPGTYWLKGENGAGKTTLLKSIAGLIPFDGEIEAYGINLRKQRRLYTATVSFAEAEPVYPGFLTGDELLRFYLQTKGGDEKAARLVAADLGIAPALKQKVSTYSSGMMKKLSLTLCFTGTPRLLLLDEPFITLDAAAVDTLQKLILKFGQDVSFLISSHQALMPGIAHKTLAAENQTVKTETHAAGIA